MIYTTTIKGTNNAESQEIIKNLDPREDLLFVYGDLAEDLPVEVQYIKPINEVKTVGLLDPELAEEIINTHGEEISIGISKYELTFEDGVYGITADIEVNAAEDEDDDKKRLPLPALIVVGALTGFLTLVLVIVKMLNRQDKD